MEMSLYKIQISNEWRHMHTSISGASIHNGKYIMGFHEIILDYIELVTEYLDRYPLFKGLNIEGDITFRDIYEINVKKIHSELTRDDIPRDLVTDLSELIFWSSIKLPEFYLLTKDTMINEVYINGEKTQVYIDHEVYGKIPTNLMISREGLNAFIRIIELVHGEGIASLGGNIEVEIETMDDRFRVVVDTYPLTHGDYNLIMRRMKNIYLDIEILLKTGFISKPQKMLIEKIADKAGSILIAGEPNSGKTTLLNAYIKLIPSNIRKIYFEEARELEDLRETGYHQVFYRFSGITKKHFRENQTLFTLRRSPEYVVLGEVISDEDIEILLDTLLLGFRVAATIHARDIEGLWERFRRAYGEGFKTPVKNLDLIIHTARDIFRNRRFIHRIYRVDEAGEPKEVVLGPYQRLGIR
ncbi:MAG TPA: hypothetical protein EYH44_05930 [Thermoprotei archaeon]|nr:hypothetical protein [Thermoprotei archaeon]